MKTKHIAIVMLTALLPVLAFGKRQVVESERLPAPTYAETPQSEDAEIGMRVTALLTVSETGKVEAVELQRADAPLFAESVEEAVSQWRFKPAIRDGKPVKSRVLVPFLVAQSDSVFTLR